MLGKALLSLRGCRCFLVDFILGMMFQYPGRHAKRRTEVIRIAPGTGLEQWQPNVDIGPRPAARPLTLRPLLRA